MRVSFFFLMWTILKISIEFVIILLLFYVLVFFWPGGMWDLIFPIRDQTNTLCTGRQSLNHWTTREVPMVALSVDKSRPLMFFFFLNFLFCVGKQRHYSADKGPYIVKAMVFPVVPYGCESWTIKKAECQRIDALELWCWRRLLESLGQQGDQTSQS